MLPRQLHKIELCKQLKHVFTIDLANELMDPLFVERVVQNNGLLLNLIPEHRQTKKLVLLAVRNKPDMLKFLSSGYKRDLEIIRTACLADPLCIMYVSSRLLDDEVALFRLLAPINGMCIFYGSARVREDSQIAFAAVTQCAEAIQFLPVHMCDTWELVALALQRSPTMFKYASHRITDSEELALEAVRYSPKVFPFISHRLRTDFTFVLAAVRVSPRLLLLLPPEMASNLLILHAAIADTPDLVQHFPVGCRQLLSDTSFLLRLVQLDGKVLQYAPQHLHDDEILALAAVQSHACAYLYLSDRLKSNRGIVLATIRSCSTYIVDIPPVFYNDYEIMYTAVKGDASNVRFAPLVSREMALLAVNSAGLSLAYMPQWIHDEEVVAAAAKQHSAALVHAPHSRALVLACAHLDWRTVKYMNADFRNDREIATVCVRQEGRALRWLNFYGDAELALLALKTFPIMFEELDADLVNSESFQLAAVRIAPTLLPCFPQTGPMMAAAVANSLRPLFHTLTTQDYEALHAYVTGVLAARQEAEAFLGFKTRLHAHGRYSRRLIRAVLDYVGYTTGETWKDARVAYEKRLV